MIFLTSDLYVLSSVISPTPTLSSNSSWRDFPGGPVAKTQLQRAQGSIPGKGAKSCMPQPRPDAAK